MTCCFGYCTVFWILTMCFGYCTIVSLASVVCTRSMFRGPASHLLHFQGRALCGGCVSSSLVPYVKLWAFARQAAPVLHGELGRLAFRDVLLLSCPWIDGSPQTRLGLSRTGLTRVSSHYLICMPFVHACFPANS